jgi:uncharacterized protein (DUF924 family)
MDTRALEVLDFWFGSTGQRRREWFVKDPAFDAAITQRFGTVIEAALRGELSAWPNDGAAAALAQIVVLDQFTRNVFRNTPRAFAGDLRALDAAKAMVAAGQGAALPPLQRAFAYLPFEHAEDLAMQDESVRLFAALAREAPELNDMLDYAHRHRAVIARFGRFAHRNAVLGRESSAEEIAFLQEPGSSF